MIVTVQRVYTLTETVEIPDECPKCGTHTGECLGVGFDPYAQECSLDYTPDSIEWGSMEHDGEDIVTGYACRECGYVLAGTDGAKPIDRAPGPHADLDAIPHGRDIRRVINESPYWLAATDIADLVPNEHPGPVVYLDMIASGCERLASAGWIDRAPDSLGIRYYRSIASVDTCPVCGEPCHATEGDERGRHAKCQ